MYAIIRTGGRQYRAQVGKTLDVERMPHDVGTAITIDDVLLVRNGDTLRIGQPTVENAFVTATVTEQFRGKKVIVFKYRQRTNYRVKRGHRQYHTRIRIESINLDGTVYDTPIQDEVEEVEQLDLEQLDTEAVVTPTPTMPEDVSQEPETVAEPEAVAEASETVAEAPDADENSDEAEADSDDAPKGDTQ